MQSEHAGGNDRAFSLIKQNTIDWNRVEKILLFAGTTEGRILAEFLGKYKAKTYISVATEYGRTLLHDLSLSGNEVILCGRMNDEEIASFIRENEIDLIIDATHPYAAKATRYIREACSREQAVYIRCLRKPSEYDEQDLDIRYFGSMDETIEYLKTTKGNIFVSTGSKELVRYTEIPGWRERCYARILSTVEAVEHAQELGFAGSHLIAMQGPFSAEMNIAMLKSTGAGWFVTKESGKVGGFEEKLEAAKQTGVKLVIIGRPEVMPETAKAPSASTFDAFTDSEAIYDLDSLLGVLQENLCIGVSDPDNEHYIYKNQKKLRTGYTTGSCAAAAAKAAARMLLTGEEVREVSIMTPSGIRLLLEVEDISGGESSVSCGVRKDSGDDPDVTDGMLICADVRIQETDSPEGCVQGLNQEKQLKLANNIFLTAGEGIGTVTRGGLSVPVGEPAVNPVPRKMICEAVEEEIEKAGFQGQLSVRIRIPGGKEIAKKTFNPKLGIDGGLSVLGTSGIVEPMSEKALTDTIFLEMKMRRESGQDCCFAVPGNYGADFLRDSLGYEEERAVKCSNYIGEVIDDAVWLEMKGILIVGHIGKMIKVAAGIMNTHSRMADGRMEILAAYAACAGAPPDVAREIMDCMTTTEALEILKKNRMLEPVMGSVMKAIENHLQDRAGEKLMVGAVVFSMEEGILGKTSQADELVSRIMGKHA